MFGPYGDVLNPRMGAVHRPLFATADLCAGCHELEQEAVVPGTTIDRTRWPSGRIPVQSTYSELRDGPLGLTVPCQSCHMPPDADVGNSADLGNVTDIGEGIAGGWYREPGSVRRHVWFGPRSAEQRMLTSRPPHGRPDTRRRGAVGGAHRSELGAGHPHGRADAADRGARGSAL